MVGGTAFRPIFAWTARRVAAAAGQKEASEVIVYGVMDTKSRRPSSSGGRLLAALGTANAQLDRQAKG